MRSEFTNSEGDVIWTDPKSCKAFTPGHQWHFIQVTHSWDDERGFYQPCAVTACSSEGWLTVQIEGESETQLLWTHDPERGRGFAGEANLEINRRFSLIRTVGENYLCVADKLSSCIVESACGSLFDQLLSHGGVTVSGREALRLSTSDEDL